MKNLFTLLVCLLFFPNIAAQDVPITYYLPDISYDSNIPTPKEVLGFQIGDWHVSHDQLNTYMQRIAIESDKVIIEEYARSHENRPLFAMIFSSKENMSNLDKIKIDRQEIYSGKADKNRPVVIYQGYSIHGNESSGANAAVLMAYYLAAGNSSEINELLENAIVIIDPCFNPDGLHRFSTWANMHKSKNLVSDPNSREFSEVWPGGRTNHYWFDLNRDWLPAVHPESQGRLAKFHEWKPNILTDHHEMGSHNTYFFQPGIPSRNNPLTPTKNQDLTYEIAEFHAKQLDEIGSLYYSQESFDDFYYGKGSTYPDVNGCIGILFEQASSRGHLRETKNGLLSFPFTIRNQIATSLSTQKAGIALKESLISYQDDFYSKKGISNSNTNTKAYSFGKTLDKTSLSAFISLLLKHQIKVYSGESTDEFIVPLDQAQRYLIKTIFEKNTSFTDSLFYDVSAWTMPLAFNIPSSEITAKTFSQLQLDQPLTESPQWKGEVIGGKSSYAYVFEWDDYLAPKLLYRLQDIGLRTKVSTKIFTANTSDGKKEFNRGSIILSLQNQKLNTDEIFEELRTFTNSSPIKIYNLETGFTIQGIDIGSPSLKHLEKPKILIVAGDGASAYDVGEAWHLLDQRFNIPSTILDSKKLASVKLDAYNVLVLVHGNYSSSEKILKWLEKGGTLITFRGASRWAANNKLLNAKLVQNKNEKTITRRPYDKVSPDKGAEFIGGAIFNVKLDLTHPLAFGYRSEYLPMFKKGTLFMEPSNNPYATPGLYTSNPLMSGYISKTNLNRLKNSAAIIVSRHGSGRTIAFTDNTNFRGFWYGTNKLFANVLFFGNIIDYQTLEAPKKD